MRHHRLIALILGCVLLAGCGGSKMATVRGKITFKGEPVTAGSLTFAPKAPPDKALAGRPATGSPDENGEFQLSTHALNDGALIGEHYVMYSPPAAPETDDPVMREKLMAAYKKFGRCRLPENYVVEIKPGDNEIKLELILEPKKTAD